MKIKKIKQEFVDERGYISRIIDEKKCRISCILYIVRKKGSRGAGHYHKKDAHYVYVLSGKIKRSEKNMNYKNSKIVSKILKPGDLIFTPPMVAHSDLFLEDSIILAFTTKNRNPKQYENDTIRINFFK
jgi:dTDP-4-dehydrorhamnose 3,5-epimerase-like enzyme